MPNGGLVVVVVIQLEEETVWVDNSVALQPSWEYLILEQVLMSSSE
jgi:hypothetical protein